jgi:hypothetical protein
VVTVVSNTGTSAASAPPDARPLAQTRRARPSAPRRRVAPVDAPPAQQRGAERRLEPLQRAEHPVDRAPRRALARLVHPDGEEAVVAPVAGGRRGARRAPPTGRGRRRPASAAAPRRPPAAGRRRRTPRRGRRRGGSRTGSWAWTESTAAPEHEVDRAQQAQPRPQEVEPRRLPQVQHAERHEHSSVITSCSILSCGSERTVKPIRLAGTCSRYSNRAIPQSPPPRSTTAARRACAGGRTRRTS